MSELVSDVLRRSFSALTPAEQRIVRVVLSDYPRAGLESASRLARRASASAPTVVRLAIKLGYRGYPELQDQLREELAQRAASPLNLFDRGERAGGLTRRAGDVIIGAVQETLATLPDEALTQVAEGLCNHRDRVIIGGRYSSTIAEYFSLHLTLLLPRVRLVPLSGMGRTSALLDVGPRTMVVAYDFRRYQNDTVEFCRRAKTLGARIALFTDPWLSPAADYADIVMPCSVGSVSPFDSATAAMASTEVIVSLVVDQLGDSCKERLATFEENQEPWG